MLFGTAACLSSPSTSGLDADRMQDGECCPAGHTLVDSTAGDFWEAQSPFRHVCVSAAEYRCVVFVKCCETTCCCRRQSRRALVPATTWQGPPPSLPRRGKARRGTDGGAAWQGPPPSLPRASNRGSGVLRSHGHLGVSGGQSEVPGCLGVLHSRAGHRVRGDDGEGKLARANCLNRLSLCALNAYAQVYNRGVRGPVSAAGSSVTGAPCLSPATTRS